MSFFFTVTSTTKIYTLSLHDALPISARSRAHRRSLRRRRRHPRPIAPRSEEHTSELQSLRHLVCRLLLEKKNRFRTGAIGERTHAFRKPIGDTCSPPKRSIHALPRLL